jgi:hypothetical protein
MDFYIPVKLTQLRPSPMPRLDRMTDRHPSRQLKEIAMAMLRSAATDPMLDAARAFLRTVTSSRRLRRETRRNLIETHLKSLEHRLTAMHSAQSRKAGLQTGLSLQAAQAWTQTDQAEAQAALARAWRQGPGRSRRHAYRAVPGMWQ